MGFRRRSQSHVCEAISDVASTAAMKTPKVKDNLHNVMLIKGEVASADTAQTEKIHTGNKPQHRSVQLTLSQPILKRQLLCFRNTSSYLYTRKWVGCKGDKHRCQSCSSLKKLTTSRMHSEDGPWLSAFIFVSFLQSPSHTSSNSDAGKSLTGTGRPC